MVDGEKYREPEVDREGGGWGEGDWVDVRRERRQGAKEGMDLGFFFFFFLVAPPFMQQIICVPQQRTLPSPHNASVHQPVRPL